MGDNLNLQYCKMCLKICMWKKLLPLHNINFYIFKHLGFFYINVLLLIAIHWHVYWSADDTSVTFNVAFSAQHPCIAVQARAGTCDVRDVLMCKTMHQTHKSIFITKFKRVEDIFAIDLARYILCIINECVWGCMSVYFTIITFFYILVTIVFSKYTFTLLNDKYHVKTFKSSTSTSFSCLSTKRNEECVCWGTPHAYLPQYQEEGGVCMLGHSHALLPQ